MAARPWMPLYIADYRADTAHLSAAQHGAYLLLIMHYWTTGGLPDDDGALARIACMTPTEWRKTKPIVVTFFSTDWKHKRIDSELDKMIKTSEAASRAGKASAAKRSTNPQRNSNDRSTDIQRPLNDRANDPANGNPTTTHSHSHSEKQDAAAAGGEPPSAEKQLFERGKIVLGQNAGGQISKLLKAKGSVALARAAIETASTKENPREYVAAILRGNQEAAAKPYNPII